MTILCNIYFQISQTSVNSNCHVILYWFIVPSDCIIPSIFFLTSSGFSSNQHFRKAVTSLRETFATGIYKNSGSIVAIHTYISRKRNFQLAAVVYFTIRDRACARTDLFYESLTYESFNTARSIPSLFPIEMHDRRCRWNTAQVRYRNMITSALTQDLNHPFVRSLLRLFGGNIARLMESGFNDESGRNMWSLFVRIRFSRAILNTLKSRRIFRSMSH